MFEFNASTDFSESELREPDRSVPSLMVRPSPNGFRSDDVRAIREAGVDLDLVVWMWTRDGGYGSRVAAWTRGLRRWGSLRKTILMEHPDEDRGLLQFAVCSNRADGHVADFMARSNFGCDSGVALVDLRTRVLEQIRQPICRMMKWRNSAVDSRENRELRACIDDMVSQAHCTGGILALVGADVDSRIFRSFYGAEMQMRAFESGLGGVGQRLPDAETAVWLARGAYWRVGG